jgi:hypothetical protein
VPGEEKANEAGNWKSVTAQRAFMVGLGQQLGIKEDDLNGWYKITQSQLLENHGRWLLNLYGVSLSRILMAVFPEHPWDINKFEKKPHQYWFSKDHEREAVNRVGETLGIKPGDYEAWYEVKLSLLLKTELGATRRDRSRFEFFSSVFPEFDWKPWLFEKSTFNVLKFSNEDLSLLSKYLEKQLQIQSPEDWYSISKGQIDKLGFGKPLSRQGALTRMLQVAYPEIEWDSSRFRIGYHGFGLLMNSLIQLFDIEVILGRDYCQSLSPLWDKSAFRKTIVIPKFKILFDYQGPQYYAQRLVDKRRNSSVLERFDRSVLKRWCSENDFTLISFPFWAERDRKTLLGELWTLRRDLFVEGGPLSNYSKDTNSFVAIISSIPIPGAKEDYFRRWAQEAVLGSEDRSNLQASK